MLFNFNLYVNKRFIYYQGMFPPLSMRHLKIFLFNNCFFKYNILKLFKKIKYHSGDSLRKIKHALQGVYRKLVLVYNNQMDRNLESRFI